MHPDAPSNLTPLKFHCTLMRPVTQCLISLAVTRKLNSPEYHKAPSHHMHKFSCNLRTNSTDSVEFFIFPEFFNFMMLLLLKGRWFPLLYYSKTFVILKMQSTRILILSHKKIMITWIKNWDDNESSNEYMPAENQSQVPQNAIHWSSTQPEIDVEIFSLSWSNQKPWRECYHKRFLQPTPW